MSEVANTILFWAWSLSLIAFIVYWRKKVNAKKEIGTNPEKYTKVAKIKRIIGIFCALSFAGFFFNSSNVSIDTPTKSAKVEQTVDLGTHTLFIASVEDMDVLSNDPSATYAYYHSSIKPKPQETKPSGKVGWRCKICGYVYEGEELASDFVCPWCKHPASDFEKIEL